MSTMDHYLKPKKESMAKTTTISPIK